MKDHEKSTFNNIKVRGEEAIVSQEFSYNPKTISAYVFNSNQIDEFVTRVEYDLLDIKNKIPWYKIRSVGNRLVNDYEDIQFNRVWDALLNFLPELINDINPLLDYSEIKQ